MAPELSAPVWHQPQDHPALDAGEAMIPRSLWVALAEHMHQQSSVVSALATAIDESLGDG
jgi:hypothetical protein